MKKMSEQGKTTHSEKAGPDSVGIDNCLDILCSVNGCAPEEF